MANSDSIIGYRVGSIGTSAVLDSLIGKVTGTITADLTPQGDSSIGWVDGSIGVGGASAYTDSPIGWTVGSMRNPTGSTLDSRIGFAPAGTILNPHHPVGIWDGTALRYMPVRVWDGSQLR